MEGWKDRKREKRKRQVFREGAQDIAREAARENARKQRKLQAAEFREPIWAYLSGMIDRRLFCRVNIF